MEGPASSRNASYVAGPDSSTLDELELAMRAFERRGFFVFSSHPEPCCQVVREWFAGLTRAHQALDGASLTWIRQRWSWGPHAWPLPWCDLAEARELDCGAHAALAREALRLAGQDSVNIQALQAFDDSATETWRETWKDHGGGAWLSGPFACHEVVGVITHGGAHLRIWDPTDACWIEDRPTTGYASAVALRITSDAGTNVTPARYQWRGRTIEPNRWHLL